jgi:hypothetical protein
MRSWCWGEFLHFSVQQLWNWPVSRYSGKFSSCACTCGTAVQGTETGEAIDRAVPSYIRPSPDHVSDPYPQPSCTMHTVTTAAWTVGVTLPSLMIYWITLYCSILLHCEDQTLCFVFTVYVQPFLFIVYHYMLRLNSPSSGVQFVVLKESVALLHCSARLRLVSVVLLIELLQGFFCWFSLYLPSDYNKSEAYPAVRAIWVVTFLPSLNHWGRSLNSVKDTDRIYTFPYILCVK